MTTPMPESVKKMVVLDAAQDVYKRQLLQILRGQAALDGTGGGNILEGRGLHLSLIHI